MDKFKWLVMEGSLVAFTDGEAWQLTGNRWVEINSADAAMNGVSITEDEAKSRFKSWPKLPEDAFSRD